MKIHLHVLLFAIISTSLHAQIPQLWGNMVGGGLNNVGTIFKIDGDGNNFTSVFSFTGASPQGNLVPKDATDLFGMTNSGGDNFEGDIFYYNVSSGDFTVVYSFDGTNGSYPRGSLVPASDGNFYGTAYSGGANGRGTIFWFDPATFQYTKLHDFTSTEGEWPAADAIEAPNGKLYGTTPNGGSNGYGTIWSYDISTGTFTNEYNFSLASGAIPYGNLIPASNGKLYGMTSDGGANSDGVIFSFDPATSTFTLLHSLTGSEGITPYGSLMQATDGLLYGMTWDGGANGYGTIISFNIAAGSLTNIHDFDGNDGSAPNGNLMQASDGKLYGMTSLGAGGHGTIFSFDITAGTCTLLQGCNSSTGEFPYADLIEFPGALVVEDPDQNNIVSISPVPSDGNISIALRYKNSEDVTLVIYDALGSKLKQLQLTQAVINLNLSYLAGIYLVSIISDEGSATKKIVLR